MRMLVNPNQIRPSQDFLKEGTVQFIMRCFKENDLDALPPAPIVRKDADGRLVAIDGHNLIAVKLYREEDLEVVLAESAEAILPDASLANADRNSELKNKYGSVLADADKVQAVGISSFGDLIAKYPKLFQ
jgi:hypothetical protein